MAKTYPISRAINHTVTLNDLTTMRRDLAGQREQALKQIAEIEPQIVHLDAVLRMFGFDDFRSLKPIHRLKNGKITKIDSRERRAAIMQLLQANPNGKTSVQISEHLIEKFSLDANDKREKLDARNYARKVLNRWQLAGKVEVCDFTGPSKCWRLVKPKSVECTRPGLYASTKSRI